MAAFLQSNSKFYIKENFTTSLSVGGTFKISGDLEDNSVIDSGGVNTFVVLKNESQLERFSVTIAGGITTIVKRGLKKDWVTEDTNLRKIWWEGSIGYITPAPLDFIATGKLDTAGGLRNTMGNALWMFEVTPSWIEVKRWITVWSGVPADTALIQYTDPTTREKLETTYSEIKNALSSAGKYIQSIPLGEELWSWVFSMAIIRNSITTEAIPTLTSDSWNANFIASATWFSAWSAFQAFDNNISTSVSYWNSWWNWTLRIDLYRPVFLAAMTVWTGSSNALYISTANASFSIHWSNDWTNWTSIQWFSQDWSWNIAPTSIPAQSTAYSKYKVTWTTNAWWVTLYNWNFSYTYANINWAIQFSNALGSNIAWARLKSWIVFKPLVTDQLGRVYIWQNCTSSNWRIQLYDSLWTTLISEKTPTTGTDFADFTDVLLKDTEYVICINNNAYFNAQSNELILATYQANNWYCVSWYLDWDRWVNPQAIRRIDFWTKKAVKSIANTTAEYAILAWFITWPKNKWDLLELNSNDWILVSWFSGLTPLSKYYVSNTSWMISTTAWTISRIVWMAVSATELYISSLYYPWTNVTKP